MWGKEKAPESGYNVGQLLRMGLLGRDCASGFLQQKKTGGGGGGGQAQSHEVKEAGSFLKTGSGPPPQRDWAGDCLVDKARSQGLQR